LTVSLARETEGCISEDRDKGKYEILTKSYNGNWINDGVAEPNKFASEKEATEAMEKLIDGDKEVMKHCEWKIGKITT